MLLSVRAAKGRAATGFLDLNKCTDECSDLELLFHIVVDMSSSWTSWDDFAGSAPLLAGDIRALLEQYGRGFGYLATIRGDGGPRVHPVAPVIADGGLFCFVIPSPKRRDLERDGRYALHSYPGDQSPDEAYLAGQARPVTDAERIDRLAELHRAAIGGDWRLFELDISVAMVTHRPAALARADHRVWHANGRRFDLFNL
jgi:hypothetical protein